MPTEIVTLKPTIGSELAMPDGLGLFNLGQEVDWGDHVIEPSLATGPDVVGGVVGTRTRAASEATIPIRVSGATAVAYLAAAEALAEAANQLARYGGTIARQVDFGSGNLSEELECEVYSCDLDPEDGWMQAHRMSGMVTLVISRGPAWLAVEEELATDATFTDSVKRLAYTAGGNLPGPARVVLEDNDSTARRFLELGGATEQTPQLVEYLADDFTLVAGTLDVTGETDAIGAEAIKVTPVLPVWTTVGILEDLPHSGSYRIRLRSKGGEDDSQFTSRVVWRSGSGPWKDLGERVETPDAVSYYDLDAGSLYKYDSAETIDVRVDVKSSTAAAGPYSLNSLTLTPSNLYSVSRGVSVDVPNVGSVAFDDFADMDDGDVLDDGATPRVAPAGGAWDETGDTSPEPSVPSDGAGYLELRAADHATTNVGTGFFGLLGTTDYPAVENTVAGRLAYDGPKTTDALFGAVVRYVDANNWLIAAMRIRRQNDGKYSPYIALYKRVAGTITRIDQVDAADHLVTGGAGQLIPGSIGVSVTAAGAWEVKAGHASTSANADRTVMSGTDSVLATAGALATGQVGAYKLLQSDRSGAYTQLSEIVAYGTIPASQHTDVIREDGIGVLTHNGSYAADADDADPQDFTPQGSRMWLPPGTGEITAKVRSSESETQPDEGYDLDTAITLSHRRAYATLSDSLE